MTDPAVTYASYLKIDELLALQQPRSAGPEHDELLFIVIFPALVRFAANWYWYKEIGFQTILLTEITTRARFAHTM